VALPRGGPERDKAEQAIRGMASGPMQVETLRSNAFFPVTSIELPTDLPGGIALEARAVKAQRTAEGALLALPPVGIGSSDGQMSQVFKDCFTQICLDGRPARQVVDAQAGVLSGLLDKLKVPCWAPDPPGAVCEVGR
jgi:multiple sugar transport system substrate-binding protein